MTGLATNKAAQFVRGDNFKSSQAVTESSGIRALLPASRIDDYVFEPCGYSMNGVDGLQVSLAAGLKLVMRQFMSACQLCMLHHYAICLLPHLYIDHSQCCHIL